MNQELMTLDFWQDTVIYEGKTFPVGTLACDALNVPADIIAKMNEQCEKINLLLGLLNAGQDASALFPMAREAALTMLGILNQTPPFSYMNISQHRERIEKVFTADNALKYVEFAIKAATDSLQFEEVPKYTDAMMLQRYTAVFGHLAYSLGEYQTAMLDFAEKSDGNEADRTAEGFAKMFGSYFPPKFSITDGNVWMSTLNNSVQYVATIRPGEDVAKLVKRMHYVSFVGMFRSDLFEGLCVGHAPKKCRICGKWFLTTNARHTKYCGGYAPGDKLHRTCRQVGNLKGREQRELADDHPLKQIYEKRLNTINRYVKRGTLDADLAEIMKKLAKDKMLRALSNVAYAKGDYEKEMGQASLKKEAKLIPVILLTANDTDMDIVDGLERGADDYITKPFSLSVLRARVNTQLRKKITIPNNTPIHIDHFCFDFGTMTFCVGDAKVELSKTEQKLLNLLVENHGRTMTRGDLVDRIWTDGAEYVDENALSVTIKRLRDKLGAQEYIKTVYGIGYSWVKKDE